MDNWKHRSSNMKCSSCMWFVLKGESFLGRCRRAPTLNGWPVVMISDWCGDHKLDETKIRTETTEDLDSSKLKHNEGGMIYE